MSILIIDTEGNPSLKEIAIIDGTGDLIYHAFSQEERSDHPQPRPLHRIVEEVGQLIQGNHIIFHYADHDVQILKTAFQKCGGKWAPARVSCSWKLSQQYLPDLSSYSLESLSKVLGLKMHGQYFHNGLAHDASYDAQFTYLLYCHIQKRMLQSLTDQPNPFASNRVDNPFQKHLDELGIFQAEFEILKTVLQDIHRDPNHQSSGVVLIGEPGSGKTHLIMRLAQQLLKRHRLLFIRQPNNPGTVLHHIYSRTLESLVESVDGEHTQLDYLLAKSFVHILNIRMRSKRDTELMRSLEENPLNLFHRLGAEGTERRRSQWQMIERHILSWWTDQHSIAGFSSTILQGIIKFCSYKDRQKREQVTRWLAGTEIDPEEAESIGLPNWSEKLSRESFSLEAMSLIGKLSLLDEPLIIVFDQLESLGLSQYHDLLLSFGEAIKELFTHVPNSLFILNLFPERWEQWKSTFDGAIIDRVSQYQLRLQRPTNEQIKSILQLKLEPIGLELEALFSKEDLSDILSHTSIRSTINRAADYYRYQTKGIPLPLSVQSIAKTEVQWQQKVKQLESDVSYLKQAVDALLQASPDITVLEIKEESIVDDPIFEAIETYLEESEKVLESSYRRSLIITDEDDIGKLRRISDALQTVHSFDVGILKVGSKKLPEHLYFKSTKRVMGFLHTSSPISFSSRLKNYNELVISHPELRFGLFRDHKMPKVSGGKSLQELSKLEGTKNGKFLILEKDDRIFFELINKLILDIQNKDLEVELSQGIQVFLKLRSHWMIKMMLGTD